MIQPPGSGKGRCNLRHAQSDHKTKDDTGRPNDSCRGTTYSAQTQLERGDSSRKNANDRKRNGKIGESAHPAVQLLGVAHALKQFYVIGGPSLMSVGRGWEGLFHRLQCLLSHLKLIGSCSHYPTASREELPRAIRRLQHHPLDRLPTR